MFPFYCKRKGHKKILQSLGGFKLGRQVGFEPTTHGTTIRYSNQLSYNRRVLRLQKYNFFHLQTSFLKKIFSIQ